MLRRVPYILVGGIRRRVVDENVPRCCAPPGSPLHPAASSRSRSSGTADHLGIIRSENFLGLRFVLSWNIFLSVVSLESSLGLLKELAGVLRNDLAVVPLALLTKDWNRVTIITAASLAW